MRVCTFIRVSVSVSGSQCHRRSNPSLTDETASCKYSGEAGQVYVKGFLQNEGELMHRDNSGAQVACLV